MGPGASRARPAFHTATRPGWRDCKTRTRRPGRLEAPWAREAAVHGKRATSLRSGWDPFECGVAVARVILWRDEVRASRRPASVRSGSYASLESPGLWARVFLAGERLVGRSRHPRQLVQRPCLSPAAAEDSSEIWPLFRSLEATEACPRHRNGSPRRPVGSGRPGRLLPRAPAEGITSWRRRAGTRRQSPCPPWPKSDRPPLSPSAGPQNARWGPRAASGTMRNESDISRLRRPPEGVAP